MCFMCYANIVDENFLFHVENLKELWVNGTSHGHDMIKAQYLVMGNKFHYVTIDRYLEFISKR